MLTQIQKDVELQLRRTPLARFLLQGSVTELLEDRIHQFETAWRAFDVRFPSVTFRLSAHS